MKRLLPLVLLLILALVAFPMSVRADVAPPQNPPGSNPGPGSDTTQVRMLAETVVVNVLQADPPRAYVTADFTMHNLGSKTENLAVRFPISASDGWSNYPEIKNVGIEVDGQRVTYQRTQGPEPIYNFEGTQVPWAQFDVSFPPGQDVKIHVSYDLDGTGYPSEWETSFYYLLHTGAGWKGTIGSAEIILRLPYQASPQNVILSDYGTQGAKFSGQEVRWTYSDLEPTRENDFTFEIVKTSVWKNVLTEQKNTELNPQDGEAWGRLGKAYKEAYFASPKHLPRIDEGAPQLYDLSKAAYEKAVTLLPKDGLWHAGYAELLLENYIWTTYYQYQAYTPDLQLGLQELDLAYQLAPNEAKVKELLERYSSLPFLSQKADGSPDFPSLTQTPQMPNTSAEAPTETTASPAEATVVPTSPLPTIPVPSANAQPPSKPALPICGGAALAPLVLFLWIKRRKAST